MNGFPWTIKDFEMFVLESRRGVAKLVKAPDFDSGMRGFESFLPCHFFEWQRLGVFVLVHLRP